MKFLFLLSLFGVAFANIEMNDEPPAGHCNAIYHCPLKKEYKDAGLVLSEEEDKKLYSKYKQCCSFYGHCGTTAEYCQIGCQSGDCDENFISLTRRMMLCSTYELLGKCDEDCPCPEGQCCSKYGYCGKGPEYCGSGSDKKEEEPKKSKKVSTNGRCGSNDGSCPEGQCCSKYGWCGKDDKYCLKSSGCQSEFGLCREKTTTKTTSTKNSSSTGRSDGLCGEKYGPCKEGYCCSKYGWCGTTDAYCSKSKGCQSKFGKCN